MRNKVVDIAKGIGILTVVICHNWILYHDRGEFSRIVFSFHMPLFFFISGIFFKPNLSFKSTFTSKAISLLKPYVTVVVVLILYDLIHTCVKGEQLHILREIVKVLYSSTNTLDWVQLWFLSHLFTVFLCSWLMYRIIFKNINNQSAQLFIAFVLFYFGTQIIDVFWVKTFNPLEINSWLYGNNPQLLGLPLNIDILLATTPIFLAGHLLSNQLLAFKFNHLLFWFSLLVFSIMHYSFDYTMALHAREYNQFSVTTAQMITGIYLTFGLSALIAKLEIPSTIFSYLGSASLFILIFHFSIQHKFTGVFQNHFPEYSYLIAFIAFVFSIVSSLVIYEIVIRFSFLRQFFIDTTKK